MGWFSGNDCVNGGGAIYMTGGLVENSVFRGNIGNT
jgi:predicted outer membrane repeat protein